MESDSPAASIGASAGGDAATRQQQVSPLREEGTAAGQGTDGLALLQVVGLREEQQQVCEDPKLLIFSRF